MYEKDKRQRITLRLSDEQFEFIKSQTDILGITPSDYIRMLINSVFYMGKKSPKAGQIDLKEVLGRENDKTDSDHLL